MKLRHQDIRFFLNYSQVQKNPADYPSRPAISQGLLNKFGKKEPDDLTNLLYTLHVSPVIDATSIKKITEHTTQDTILNELKELIKSVKT